MKNSEPLSSLIHFVGFLLSIAGLVLLIIFGVIHGEAKHVVGFSIFGAGLIILYLASTIYHGISKTHWIKSIFRKIDHSMIYVLIASTYTPLTLTLPQRAWGWSIFGIIWGLALAGILLKVTMKNEKRWLSPIFYIFMGWFAIIALPIFVKSFPPNGLAWLISGGILYTSGVIFFALGGILPQKRLFGMHEIFHLFVIGGSFAHFWFMLKYVVYI